jgi:hypothetical protein
VSNDPHGDGPDARARVAAPKGSPARALRRSGLGPLRVAANYLIVVVVPAVVVIIVVVIIVVIVVPAIPEEGHLRVVV